MSPEDFADVINGAQQDNPNLTFKVTTRDDGAWIWVGIQDSDDEDQLIGWFPNES